ncbi:MAG: thiamine phosphate synthase, partial [Dehalococcoidia bacterium]
EVRNAVQLPVIGIGGINASNAAQVMQAGASGVAVISAVCSADDPKAAAEELVKIIE